MSQAEPPILQRRYPVAPLVGVAAAVFNSQGKVLLVQRGRPPRVGAWGLPGGLLDLGERLAVGAAREVREECSVEIAVGGVAGVFEPITYDAAGRIEYHYVVVDFWASHVAGDPVASDDAAAVQWVDLEALDRYALSPESAGVIRTAYALWRASRE